MNMHIKMGAICLVVGFVFLRCQTTCVKPGTGKVTATRGTITVHLFEYFIDGTDFNKQKDVKYTLVTLKWKDPTTSNYEEKDSAFTDKKGNVKLSTDDMAGVFLIEVQRNKRDSGGDASDPHAYHGQYVTIETSKLSDAAPYEIPMSPMKSLIHFINIGFHVYCSTTNPVTNIQGAECYVDGIDKGATDSNGIDFPIAVSYGRSHFLSATKNGVTTSYNQYIAKEDEGSDFPFPLCP